MSEIIAVGPDQAKTDLQEHGADALGAGTAAQEAAAGSGSCLLRADAPCVVTMEACGGAHFRGREIGKPGHGLRLIPPADVKPFSRRQPDNAADPEAICKAAQRPTMRSGAVKRKETEGLRRSRGCDGIADTRTPDRAANPGNHCVVLTARLRRDAPISAMSARSCRRGPRTPCA